MEKLQTGMNKKSGQGLYYFCEQLKLFFLWRVILNNCTNENQTQMKSTIIAMNEQSHKGPRAEEDHCILYMTESETYDTLVAVKALYQITYIELRQNYLVQGAMASELKKHDAQSSSSRFQLT